MTEINLSAECMEGIAALTKTINESSDPQRTLDILRAILTAVYKK